jgi:hypothetical protein
VTCMHQGRVLGLKQCRSLVAHFPSLAPHSLTRHVTSHAIQVEYVTEAQAKLLRDSARLVKPVQPP